MMGNMSGGHLHKTQVQQQCLCHLHVKPKQALSIETLHPRVNRGDCQYVKMEPFRAHEQPSASQWRASAEAGVHLHGTVQGAGTSWLGCMCAGEQAINSHRALRLLAANAQHPQRSPRGCVACCGRWGGERHAAKIVRPQGSRAVACAGGARKAGATACRAALHVCVADHWRCSREGHPAKVV